VLSISRSAAGGGTSGIRNSVRLRDCDAPAMLESQSMSISDEERLDLARQENNLCFGIVRRARNEERIRNQLDSSPYPVERIGGTDFLTDSGIFADSATSEKNESTAEMLQLPMVPHSGRLSTSQFLSVKQPLPTEIQLRTTAAAQPISPVKNTTSSTRIANTANLIAML
jgi:hypothetical protein